MFIKSFLNSRRKLNKKIIFFFSATFFFLNFSKAQTNVSGGIYSNATWTLAGSPYIISGTVTLFAGDTLTIQPGVVVQFHNNAVIEDRGFMHVNGTIADSIIFTSDSTAPYAGVYIGIIVSGSILSNYCRFSYAYGGIYIPNSGGPTSPPIITHCLFKSDLNGIYQPFGGIIDTCTFKYDTLGLYAEAEQSIMSCEFQHNGRAIEDLSSSLSNCTFRNNGYGIYSLFAWGHAISNCTFDSNTCALLDIYNDTITNCVIKYNYVGINNSGLIAGNDFITLNDISDNYIGIETYNDNIYCNIICNNTHYNIVAEMTANENARDNYWCLPDSAAIQASIYDGYQDVNLGLVFFTPFNSSPCAGTPTLVKELPAAVEEIKLYPDPNNGSFTVSISNYVSGVNTIDVYNMLGEKVYSSAITQSTLEITLNNNSKGVYLYRIVSEDGKLRGDGKFVVE